MKLGVVAAARCGQKIAPIFAGQTNRSAQPLQVAIAQLQGSKSHSVINALFLSFHDWQVFAAFFKEKAAHLFS
jgi:hypothetical protein